MEYKGTDPVVVSVLNCLAMFIGRARGGVIRRCVVIDRFGYPIDRLSCRESLLLRMLRAIWSVHQLLYSGHQLCLGNDSGHGECELTAIPANSLIIGYEATGANAAHSTTCSWPLSSTFVSPVAKSHTRDVYHQPSSTMLQTGVTHLITRCAD